MKKKTKKNSTKSLQITALVVKFKKNTNAAVVSSVGADGSEDKGDMTPSDS